MKRIKSIVTVEGFERSYVDLKTALKTQNNSSSGYNPPASGIPATDLAGNIPKSKLATAVQTSLGKADTAVQPTALTELFASIVYDQTTHRFNFYGKGDTSHTTPLAYIDATQLSGIVDNLNTNDAFSALSAAQGVFIKSQINFVYDKLRALFDLLASVAFLDAKPAKSTFLPDLNWSNATTYDISYSLTHLNATSMPTTIDEGASSIIVLEPEANHVLPLAVRVTNATLESYNKNTGEIVISNPTDDVEIEADAICTDYRVLFPAVLADYSGTYYNIATYPNDAGNRACVVVPRLNLVNACTWGASSSGVTSQTAEYHAAYSTIPIPFGATRVVITFTNSTYSMSSALFNARGANQKTTAWDSAQASARVYELSQYPSATHVGFNFKMANNSPFPEAPTLSQLGLSIEFE